MNELLEQFVLECRELVEAATEDLLALERSPSDRHRLDSAFRGFHTLKGAAGIVGFPAMGRVMHAAEEVLASVRNGDRPVSGELIGHCLSCLDQVVQWLDETASRDAVPIVSETVATALVARLTPASDVSPAASDQPIGEQAWFAPFLNRHAPLAGRARAAFRYVPDAGCFFRDEDPLGLVSLVPGMLAMELSPREPWPPADALDPFECNLIITALTASPPGDVLMVLQAVSARTDVCPVDGAIASVTGALPPEALAVLEEQCLVAANEAAEGFAGRLGSAGRVAANVLRRVGRAELAPLIHDAVARGQREGNGAAFVTVLRTALPVAADPPLGVGPHPRSAARTARALRVDVDRIDALVNLAGELIVAKNAVGHSARRARDGADADSLARALKDQHALLDRLVGTLRQSVLAIRMLPMGQTFRRFPRLIREMARELGKPVRLVIEGEATEADKSSVEALFEPLLHVLRNALDHGIEPEAERRAVGKPAEATVTLRAARAGDQVIVEASDDGRGIDPAQIRTVAAERGLASATVLAGMPDEAVTDLIFAPGFSTAAVVTGHSGRGVGMDAVRAAVARLGGHVSVASQPGAGTSVRIVLPFSVMMLRVMTVEAADQVFGIPIEAVLETIRVPRARIVRIGAAEVIVTRDRTMPLIRLRDVLGLPAGSGSNQAAAARIVVVAVADQTAALEVENLGERMDIMLKPMEGLLAETRGFAGTTVLGDGRVLIVLDPGELLA
jgi:two-component system chemotaxis sensor kinase CheA